MIKRTETMYCDRCGMTIERKRDGWYIGSYDVVSKKVGRPVKHGGGSVRINAILAYEDNPLDLCDDCLNSLARWFNEW